MHVPREATARPAAARAGRRQGRGRPQDGRHALRLLLAATAASFVGYALLLPVVPMWAARSGASESGAGATTGVFMGATVAGQLAMPWLLRRVGHRTTLTAGALLLGVPAPLHALLPSPGATLAICAVRGVGLALLSVSGSALAAEVVPPAFRGRAVGSYGIALGLPQLVGLPLGPWLAEHWGFVPVFAAGLLPALATLPLLLIAHPAARGPRHAGTGAHGGDGADGSAAPAPPPRTRRLRGLRGLTGPWAVMLGVTLSTGAVITFVPSYAPGGTGPFALFALTAAMLGARWLVSQLSDRRGRTGSLLPASVLTAVAGLALTAVSFALPAPRFATTATVSMLLGGALAGAAFGAVQGDVLLLMFSRAGRAGYARASTLWNIAYDGGTGLGAALLGALAAPFGLPAAFTAATLLVLTVLPTALHVRRTALSPTPGTPT